MIGRLWIAALVCAALFVALGVWVAHHPLARIDVESAALRARNVPLAIVFTASGYGLPLSCLGAGSIAAAFALRASVAIPLALLASQILSQVVVNAVKSFFARPRPDAWLYRHELGFSYPSGHATTAVVFYGAWLVVMWLAPLPLGIRVAGVALLALWALGIGWSRVALGAHYPTDVIGGYLFGLAWLCGALALAASRHPGLAARLAFRATS